MGDLNPRRVAFSLALVTAILSIICALLIAVAPEAMTKLFGTIFHGIDIQEIATPFSWGNAVLGTIVITVIALITGWLFAVVYNKIR